MKREDYISWEEFFMLMALTAAQRSKDPSSQVGACIVDSDNRIVSVGYNGMPNGMSDEFGYGTRYVTRHIVEENFAQLDETKDAWSREGDWLDTKYPYVVHAEKNAILNAQGRNLKGCTLYVTMLPCNDCATMIVQSGIKKVVYVEDKYPKDDKFIAGRVILRASGVIIEKYQPSHRKLTFEL
ncbi:MAG: dCMP deaminase family protein [Candidatus Nomurabacteria bacterium]|jgi:dCMP deaminase|nr:dCMP deaminase family protein [Candidatus Nomurabacteria bacterium]